MKIDFIHDLACPFCRIGKRYMDLALQQWQDPPVEVNFKAFILNTSIPAEGYNFADYMSAKGGGKIPLEHFFAQPRQMGQEVGLTFNFEKITRAPNTLLAHRLIFMTPQDQRSTLVEALYAAYFEFAQDIGDIDVLLAIANDQGLPIPDLRSALEGDQCVADVESESWSMHRLGVKGVPYYIINDEYHLNGSQPPQIIIDTLQKALDNSRSKTI